MKGFLSKVEGRLKRLNEEEDYCENDYTHQEIGCPAKAGGNIAVYEREDADTYACEKCGEGDEHAYVKLYSVFFRQLLRKVLNMLRNIDSLQKLFVPAHFNLPKPS